MWCTCIITFMKQGPQRTLQISLKLNNKIATCVCFKSYFCIATGSEEECHELCEIIKAMFC